MFKVIKTFWKCTEEANNWDDQWVNNNRRSVYTEMRDYGGKLRLRVFSYALTISDHMSGYYVNSAINCKSSGCYQTGDSRLIAALNKFFSDHKERDPVVIEIVQKKSDSGTYYSVWELPEEEVGGNVEPW